MIVEFIACFVGGYVVGWVAHWTREILRIKRTEAFQQCEMDAQRTKLNRRRNMWDK